MTPTGAGASTWAPRTRSTPSEHPVLDHPRGAAGRLLRSGLEDEAHAAGEVAAAVGAEEGGGAQHGGDAVGVVAAGVHHPGVLGGEREAARLGDGEGVHVGADEERRAGGLALEVGDDAGAAHAGAHGEAEGAGAIGDEIRRCAFSA